MDDGATPVVVDVEELHLELKALVERERRVHLQAATTVEHPLHRVLEAFETPRLKRKHPLREQMSRDLPPIPGRVSPDVTNVVADEVGRARRDGRAATTGRFP